MSSEKKVAKPKVVKVSKEVKPALEPAPKPKRASRAKKIPTKEEVLADLKETSDELKQIVLDLKTDEQILSSLKTQLKKVPELLKVSIENMEEDIKDLDEHYQEVLSAPVEQPST